MRLSVVTRIARKELTLFFAAPVGYLFLAAFLAVTLFVFFWGESFFARNIADVRPMFEWMPLLLVFLSAALTMRMWSEERRTGTMEFVTTVPVSSWEFVIGKFIACWALLAVALLLTGGLPITVSVMGTLDWGPVVAGYLAAMLLGAAYIAIGLFISARTDSQIVALLLTSFLCGLLYLVGSPVLTKYVGNNLAGIMQWFGTGARFESITRGVLDFRDLYYYIGITLAFLALNVYSLQSQRWAKEAATGNHQRWFIGTSLLVANLLIANVWLAKFNQLRVDMTAGKQYSISQATKGYLQQLQEPLLIRGYFSDKTHPLLAPLVPQMQDLLREYSVAGVGNIKVELIDPQTNPEAEDEANNKYSIRPVPFQVGDRYQASLVNSYFDILVSYGDEYEVLSFSDLIEVKVQGESSLDVQLRNPEYELTRSIKKVLYGFQGGGELFANIQSPIQFTGYLSSSERLPEALVEYVPHLQTALNELVAASDEKLKVEFVDPQADGGAVAQQLLETYGFQPMSASLFDSTGFYFYLLLSDGETQVQLPIPPNMTVEGANTSIQEGLKRYASGLLKSVALVTPAPPAPPAFQGGPPSAPGNQYAQLEDVLRTDFQVNKTDLTDGVVPQGSDVLLVVDPTALNTKQVFAIDQFLMRGGTVGLATGAFAAAFTQQSLNMAPRISGLEDWLLAQGITVEKKLVMDPQNAAFPLPVTRQAGGFSFQDLQMLDYPYFPDVREPGLNQSNDITATLPQVTMAWPSPIRIKEEQNQQRKVTKLLVSSEGSWLSEDTNVTPRLDEGGTGAFTPGVEVAEQTLAVLLEGRFDSAFAGKESPLLDATANPPSPDEIAAENLPEMVVSSVIAKSPESARLFVFASNDFLADQILRMAGSAEGTIYTNTVQMMANLVDWSTEDTSLLSIRARGNFNRTLPPMKQSEQSRVEWFNYLIAALGIGFVFFFYRTRMNRAKARYRNWVGEEAS